MKLLLAAIAIMLASCASAPTADQEAAADYGSFPNDYEPIVKAYYGRLLKDPGSAQYRSISSPTATWLSYLGSDFRYGYLVCATLNAKNSYGAYVGFKTDALLIRNNVVVQYIKDAEWRGKYMC